MFLTVIILAKDEERHIGRAIESVAPIAQRVIVIDSGSSDRTIEIARDAGADVLENTWVNYSLQFNWALDQLPRDTEWVLRLDADEILTEELATEIQLQGSYIPPGVAGIYVPRRMTFLGRKIRWGGVFPVKVLRLFRAGHGRCENRWMDEHIIVDGETISFAGEILDDNRNNLTWWTQKHNAYASREVIDLLNLEYRFMAHETIADLRGVQQSNVKRWIKENLYARLPGGLRALGYFLYRYIFRLGFLDGKEGTAFHLLQGFWYRYLVDAKLWEVKSYMTSQNVDALTAIREVLGITID